MTDETANTALRRRIRDHRRARLARPPMARDGRRHRAWPRQGTLAG